MSVAMNLARLRRLRVSIELAQAKVKTLTDQRDELIASMLTAQEATGDVLGKAAGVSQPRTVQIKNAVNERRGVTRHTGRGLGTVTKASPGMASAAGKVSSRRMKAAS